MTKTRAKRLLRLEERIQELHAKAEAKKRRDANAYARKLYAKTKKRKRAERIAKNKADKVERLRIRNEKRAEKLRRAAERLAAKSKPGPRLQAILDSYAGGLAAGFERGRLWERHNGAQAATPEVL